MFLSFTGFSSFVLCIYIYRKPVLRFSKNDTEHIKKETKLLIAADKTTNFYKLEPSKYNDLLEQNITKSYKKAHPNTVWDIQTENKKIATKLGIDDRVDTTANKDAFITLKDHKPSFANKPTSRLINATKSEIGKISKVTLDRINSKITRVSKFNQWKNSTSVIEWFKAIENKTTSQLYLLRHRRILPLHQPRPSQQST